MRPDDRCCLGLRLRSQCVSHLASYACQSKPSIRVSVTHAENNATINQQKRKLSRQHDVLSHLKQKYQATDTKFSEEISKLTDEYKRTTEQFKDLQAKFRHFGKVDAQKYTQLWHLQQEEAVGLSKQLLAADRVIHEQQLGWQWQGPDEAIFISPHDVHTSGSAAAGTTAAAAVGVSIDGSTQDDQQQQQHSTAAFSASSGGNEASEGESVGPGDERSANMGSMSGAGTSRSNSSTGGGKAHGNSGSAEVSLQLHSWRAYA